MIYNWFMDLLAYVQWEKIREMITGRRYNLTVDDYSRIRNVLERGYYIILTDKKAHLSSWAVKLGHFALTGKWSKFSHALVNVESTYARPITPLEMFLFVEATVKGVKFAKFNEVFNCDSVCILKPKYYTQEEFNSAVGDVLDDVGKKYDKKFRVKCDLDRSCVEIARERMVHLPDYENKMRIFEYMIENEKNLTPQMFRDCPDFEVVLEIVR